MEHDFISALRKQLGDLRTIGSLVSLQTLALLLIHGRISLPEISEYLGRSKSTISRHMKFLQQVGLVHKTTEKTSGSIDKVIYCAPPDLVSRISALFSSSNAPVADGTPEHYLQLKKNALVLKILGGILDNITTKQVLEVKSIQKGSRSLLLKSQDPTQIHNKDQKFPPPSQVYSTGQSVESRKTQNPQDFLQYGIIFLGKSELEQYDAWVSTFTQRLDTPQAGNPETREREKANEFVLVWGHIPIREIANSISKQQFQQYMKALNLE